jgi:threonine/homoserine/homoserine lactone efflux protein
MWFEAIGKGIAVGLGLAFVIGPVFFSLIDAALRRGFKDGAKFAIGIFASDLLYAFLFWLGVGGFLAQLGQSMTLAMCGGAVLILFGLVSLTRKPTKRALTEEVAKTSYRDRYSAIGKGFLLNTFNPGTSVVWLGAGTAGADMAATGGIWLQGAFMGTILLTVLITDLSKAYLAKGLKRFLTNRTILYLNRVAGAIMVGAGALLIITVALRWADQ